MSKSDNLPSAPSQGQEVDSTDKQDLLDWLKPDAPSEIREFASKAVLLSVSRSSSSYKAPLPPSEEFRRYDEVVPGAAD